MLRCHLELSTDMILNQLPEKSIILIFYQIIEPDSGTDKYFFYLWQCPEFTQKLQVIRVIHTEILTWLREQTLSFHTDTFLQLLLAGWLTEVRSRSPNIVDVTFKIFIFNEFLCLIDQ